MTTFMPTFRDGTTATARQIIEARLGRPIGPIATMPADLRRALYLLALQLQRIQPCVTN